MFTKPRRSHRATSQTELELALKSVSDQENARKLGVSEYYVSVANEKITISGGWVAVALEPWLDESTLVTSIFDLIVSRKGAETQRRGRVTNSFLERRIKVRTGDASEATIDVLQRQLQQLDPLTDTERRYLAKDGK